MRTFIRTALLLPAALLLSASALAEPPPAAAKRAEAQGKAEEKRTEAAAKRDEKRGEAGEKRADPTEKRADIANEKAAGPTWAKRKETRAERRRDRRDEIKRKWGDLHTHPAVTNELRHHARRMAFLQRMRAVATDDSKDDLVTKIDELMEKEKARHDKKMEHLKSKGGAE
jgi:hypothetical protein